MVPETTRATIVVLGNSSAALELIEQTLRESSHRVLATNNPIEAFELARRVRIDLLIGDIALLEGHEQPLLRQFHSVQQDLKILYLGAQDDPRAGTAAGEGTLGVPFSLDELRDAVAAALAPRA
jgi:DNA-binding NtrC family response regulator